MPVNRIAHLFDNKKEDLPMAINNKFQHVEFEKFDPRLTRNIVESSDGDTDDDIDEFIQKAKSKQKTSKIVVSQNDQFSNTLNLWVGHCTTNLTKPLVKAIAKIQGVETLQIYSRYRFQLGIGKLFEENRVKQDIALLIEKYLSARDSI